MDYEKKYNEALERARQIKDGKDEWRYSDLAEITPALTEIFPELRESEDMDIVNDLTSEVPTRAVQLPDGRWVTEAFANNNCIYGRKPEERHCEYCSANCSTGHDFQVREGVRRNIELKEEYKDYVESDPVYSKLVNRNAGLSIARHFYELGCTRTAEKYDEIEYNRQRAEGCVPKQQ